MSKLQRPVAERDASRGHRPVLALRQVRDHVPEVRGASPFAWGSLLERAKMVGAVSNRLVGLAENPTTRPRRAIIVSWGRQAFPGGGCRQWLWATAPWLGPPAATGGRDGRI